MSAADTSSLRELGSLGRKAEPAWSGCRRSLLSAVMLAAMSGDLELPEQQFAPHLMGDRTGSTAMAAWCLIENAGS